MESIEKHKVQKKQNMTWFAKTTVLLFKIFRIKIDEYDQNLKELAILITVIMAQTSISSLLVIMVVASFIFPVPIDYLYGYSFLISPVISLIGFIITDIGFIISWIFKTKREFLRLFAVVLLGYLPITAIMISSEPTKTSYLALFYVLFPLFNISMDGKFKYFWVILSFLFLIITFLFHILSTFLWYPNVTFSL